MKNTNFNDEQWKTIEHFPKYQVSTYGRIKSFFKSKDGVILHSNSTSGYQRVTLKSATQTLREQVHRIVAKTFIPNPENKPFVNHINSMRNDNRLDNLEWCTPAENIRHAADNGRLAKSGRDGGIKSAALSKKLAYDMYKPMEGHVVNSWTLLEYLGRTKLNNSHTRPAFLCRCKCGTEQIIAASRLVVGNSSTRATECAKCQKTTKTLKFIDSVRDNLVDTVLGTWYFLGDHTHITQDTSTKDVKWYVQCTNCNTLDTLRHPAILANIIKSCKHCKGKDIVSSA